MWYSLLIEQLLVKVKQDQRLVARQFIHDLLFQIQSFCPDNELPPEFLLGIIDKSFAKFDSNDSNSVDAANFNQYMFGLIIVYIKYVDEQSNYNSDFLEFFFAHLLDIGVYEQLKQLALDYKQGTKLFASHQYFTATEKAACFMMNFFEHQVLQDLNYQLTINFDYLSRIFLSMQSARFIYLFCGHMSLFGNINKLFDNYIEDVWNLSFANANIEDIVDKYFFLKVNKPIKPLVKKNDVSWYALLLDKLLQKVNKYQQASVKEFIDELSRKMRIIFSNKELELEFLAGVIIQLYKTFGHEKPGSVEGALFSQYLLGLVIIYAKVVDESEAVKNHFFIGIFWRHMITLGGCELFIRRKKDYEDGLKTFGKECYCNDDDLSSDSDSEANDCYCDVYTESEAAACFIINKLERHILADLNYTLSIDLFDLTQICRDNWSFDVVYPLYQTVVSFKNTSDSFDDFIRSIANLLVPPNARYPRWSFFRKPMIEVSYENTPHMIIEEPIIVNMSPK